MFDTNQAITDAIFLLLFTILLRKMFFVKLSFSQKLCVSGIKYPSVFVFIMVEVHAQIEFFSFFLRAYVLGAENYACLKPNPNSPSYCLFSGLRHSFNLFPFLGSFLFSTGVCNFKYFSWGFQNSFKNFSTLKT